MSEVTEPLEDSCLECDDPTTEYGRCDPCIHPDEEGRAVTVRDIRAWLEVQGGLELLQRSLRSWPSTVVRRMSAAAL